MNRFMTGVKNDRGPKTVRSAGEIGVDNALGSDRQGEDEHLQDSDRVSGLPRFGQGVRVAAARSAEPEQPHDQADRQPVDHRKQPGEPVPAPCTPLPGQGSHGLSDQQAGQDRSDTRRPHHACDQQRGRCTLIGHQAAEDRRQKDRQEKKMPMLLHAFAAGLAWT